MVVHTLARGCELQVTESLARRFANPHHTFLVKRFDRTDALIDHGAQTDIDLGELWTRIVFNMIVSNTDDHLRNHGFILVPGKGWRLSPAFDMNPVPHAQGLKQNISQADNAPDLYLACAVAPYFRVSVRDAEGVIGRCLTVVRQWRTIATHVGVRGRGQDAMAAAFRLAST
jgi:serine/threonine-protein kinase HipA